ncbi:MAG TPA: RNA 2',3'-cyclic phosphodiesterase [Planctomycetaceae bacterium]|jgi:2'-5' RNA ligase|nr:RNA 2',3'-cyclic phosphodiesterase [Planctomycetaceae bacterium]
MSDTVRCFLALKIPADTALRRVLKELSAMGRALKTVEPADLHVTLKFFAEVEPNLIPKITAIAAEAASRQVRSQLILTGLGVFPHAERPSVVWVGLEGAGAETMIAIAKEIESPLETLGFVPEDRPFTPHLTLARVKARPPEELGELLARHAKTVFGTASVEEIELIHSQPTSEGFRYTVLERCPFAEGAT